MQISKLKITSKCPTLGDTISAVCRAGGIATACRGVSSSEQSSETGWMVFSLFIGRFAACSREIQSKRHSPLSEIRLAEGVPGLHPHLI